MSDHCPLLFDTHQVLDRAPRGFRFELAWFKEEGFLDMVAEIWREPVVARDFLDVIV